MSTAVNTIGNGIKNWWWFLIMGLISLTAGIAIFAKPAESYVSLRILFSLIMAGTGFSQIVFAISERHTMKNWGWTLVSGILDFALGTFLMIYPVITMATLPFIVGFYLLFRAIYLIGASIELNATGVKGWGWVFNRRHCVTRIGFSNHVLSCSRSIRHHRMFRICIYCERSFQYRACIPTEES